MKDAKDRSIIPKMKWGGGSLKEGEVRDWHFNVNLASKMATKLYRSSLIYSHCSKYTEPTFLHTWRYTAYVRRGWRGWTRGFRNKRLRLGYMRSVHWTINICLRCWKLDRDRRRWRLGWWGDMNDLWWWHGRRGNNLSESFVTKKDTIGNIDTVVSINECFWNFCKCLYSFTLFVKTRKKYTDS